MVEFDFKKIFGWMCWINLLIMGGWAGLIIMDLFSWGPRNVGIFVILAGLTLLTFAVDSLMKENPDRVKNYFIKWVLACGLFLFFALTIWVWYPYG